MSHNSDLLADSQTNFTRRLFGGIGSFHGVGLGENVSRFLFKRQKVFYGLVIPLPFGIPNGKERRRIFFYTAIIPCCASSNIVAGSLFADSPCRNSESCLLPAKLLTGGLGSGFWVWGSSWPAFFLIHTRRRRIEHLILDIYPPYAVWHP
jgi:hypothetical protein